MKNLVLRKLALYQLVGGGLIAAMIHLIYLLIPEIYGSVVSTIEEHGFTHLDVFSIQVSVSFIVVSVVTMFSQKTVVVYWEDIMQYKLINPVFSNFNAIASYIFINLLISIALIAVGSDYVYFTFFISIMLIMWLSLKMMAAYFSGDLIREELAKKYRYEKAHRKEEPVLRSSYRSHKMKLIQYTLQAIEQNEIDTVCENMQLLYTSDEISDACYIVEKMLRDDKIYMLSRVAKTCQFIFAGDEEMEYYSRMCCRLLDYKGFDEDSTYIVSIFKSMHEFHYDNSNGQPEKYLRVFSAFSDICKGYGQKGEQLIDSICSELQL